MPLPNNFYNRSTLKVAQDLLGKFLIRKAGRKTIVGKIVETEAYIGQNDLACHASRGRTKRTEVMFGPPGHAYIYIIYGMYHCLNVVTESKGSAAAVLIRAIEPICEKNEDLITKTNGPGKLCRYMLIDRRLNEADLTKDKLWVEARGVKVKKGQIIRAKRVGVDYAGKCKDYLWRFYINNNEFVSKV